MKKVSKIMLVVLVLLFALFPLTASAKTEKVFSENFAQENGEYPSSFMPLYSGAVQEVDKGSFVLVGGGDLGYASHGAAISIPSSTTAITCAYKMKSSLNMMSALAFVYDGKAVQVQFYGDTILASYGGEHDFMPVGTNSGGWVHVIIKMDVSAGTYDLIIDDVTVAEDLSVSHQNFPVNILYGTMGTEGRAALDNISIKVSDK